MADSPTRIELPVLALREHIIFPYQLLPVGIGRPQSLAMFDAFDVEDPDFTFATVTQVEDSLSLDQIQGMDDVHVVATHVRCVKLISQMREGREGKVAMIEGIKRLVLVELRVPEDTDAPLIGIFEPFEETFEGDATTLKAQQQALLEEALTFLETMVDAPTEASEMLKRSRDLGELVDRLAVELSPDPDDLLALSNEHDVVQRARLLMQWLNNQRLQANLADDIKQRMREQNDNQQREYLLRQQLRVIRDQLGEENSELDELLEQIEESDMPEEAYDACIKQHGRLSMMQPSSSEFSVTLTYIQQMLDVPWAVLSEDNLDLARAQEILDADHYGLDKVKDRIIEFLAVRSLKDDMKSPILCLHGPPGVGKTSIAKSLARALGRKFVRISLGGVRDESEIRGHRRTYVGALPGRLVRALQKAGTMNPVILLDEIDKVGADFRGDPSAALLEVLDPNQNHTFNDHYLEVDLDLSNVLFIATANRMDTLSPPLKDRMEVLDVPSYTIFEKSEIARRYLFPKQIEDHGLLETQALLADDVVPYIIGNYTREAGVRNLNRRLGDLCRSVAVEVVKMTPEERAEASITVDEERVKKALGPIRYVSEVAQREDQEGVATGLAWTSVGGDILFIEVQAMEGGKGEVTLTGQLGDVMKESVRAALSYIRAHAKAYGIDGADIKKYDLHIHVPAGAIPKDGPSAGITMFSAILSRLAGIAIKKDVAMTGEITLSGHVLPVGGIKEKVIAAHRAGIREVVLPALCVKDLVDVEDSVREEMTFYPVKRVEEIPPLVFRGWEAPSASAEEGDVAPDATA